MLRGNEAPLQRLASLTGQGQIPSTLAITLPELISLKGASFYKDHPSTAPGVKRVKPIFGPVNFAIKKAVATNPGRANNALIHGRYAVIGTNPSPFLKALRGDYIAIPTDSRTYPYLSSSEARLRVPSQAIRYVGFNNEKKTTQGVQAAYLSARYESRREETDWTVEQYLKGKTELNAAEDEPKSREEHMLYQSVLNDMQLQDLRKMPVSNLSNGQTRRSRIAKALLEQPELLILDEPFMGLDPPTLIRLHGILKKIAFKASPILILGLRPQDPIPDWISSLTVLDENNDITTTDRMLSALYTIDVHNRGMLNTALPAEISLAHALTRQHGKPLFKNPRILTEKGARTIVLPHSDLAHMKDASGIWHEASCEFALGGPGSWETYRSALSAHPERRAISDWIALTSHLHRNKDNILYNAVRSIGKQPGVGGLESFPEKSASQIQRGEPLVEMSSVVVRYGDKTVLGHSSPQSNQSGLNLTIHRGSRILLLGPNGSGKTTLLSLLTSDHPQSYALPIKFFGRTRLAEKGKPGLSLWEIQSRIGHSSPEVHTFFPKHFTIRQVLESAWAETFTSKATLTLNDVYRVTQYLEYWENELCQDKERYRGVSWADDEKSHPRFGALPFGTQRLLLLLRAIIKQPDIVVLDEPLSGMPPKMRDKALDFLENGAEVQGSNLEGLTADQALIVVSHVQDEIPYSINEFVRLPSEKESSRGVDVVQGEANDIRTEAGWERIWGLKWQQTKRERALVSRRERRERAVLRAAQDMQEWEKSLETEESDDSKDSFESQLSQASQPSRAS